MNEYNVSDYGIFTNAISTTQKLNTSIEAGKAIADECKAKLADASIFMGPAADSAQEGFTQVDAKVSTMTTNFNKIGDYLKQTSSTYQSGDQSASQSVLEVGNTSTVTAPTNAKYHLDIPNSVNQAGYTVTCYGPDGWHLGGKEQATRIAKGSKQEKVHKEWVANGAKYKNGIAVMNINGQDHYLIATSQALGNVGDTINVNFKNGQTIPCLIADAKSSHDSNYTKYGHARKDGSINVLEFEVDRLKYKSSGNPSTEKWGLEWDSKSDVASIDNFGSIL